MDAGRFLRGSSGDGKKEFINDMKHERALVEKLLYAIEENPIELDEELDQLKEDIEVALYDEEKAFDEEYDSRHFMEHDKIRNKIALYISEVKSGERTRGEFVSSVRHLLEVHFIQVDREIE